MSDTDFDVPKALSGTGSWLDDRFHGARGLRVFMKKVFPDLEMTPVPSTHPIFHSFYDIDPKNMLPPYRMSNSGEPQFLGISDAKGNLQVMIDFNNDISEYWQALDVGQCSLHDAGLAVELGVNYAVYAMTH